MATPEIIDCPQCGEPARHMTSPVHPDTGAYNCSRCAFFGTEPPLHKQHRLVKLALDAGLKAYAHMPKMLARDPIMVILASQDVVLAELKRRKV